MEFARTQSSDWGFQECLETDPEGTMPEGPELHLASLFVNRACAGVVFTGAVEKSEVSKGPPVPFASDAYCISAESRGKEVRLRLTPLKRVKTEEDPPPMDVVFRFGMSGYFCFTAVDEIPKHAHVRFYSEEDPKRVLSFVDTRRFGSWQPNGTWQRDRGPCVMFEYESFRQNVLSNLSDKAFDRPICETLLNQKYFNGIGNYLRAEILYRLSIPPFVKARTVLEGLIPKAEDTKEMCDAVGKKKVKAEGPDILSLCHTVPLEVVNLGGKVYDPEKADYTGFKSWLQCYFVDGMNTVSDHSGRTIWFKGDAGPMAPKGSKSRKTKRKIQKGEHEHTKAAKKRRAGRISKENPVKIDQGIVKKERGGPRRQNASKNKIDQKRTDENERLKPHRKTSSTGPPTRRVNSTRSVTGQKGKSKAKGTTRPKRKSRTAA